MGDAVMALTAKQNKAIEQSKAFDATLLELEKEQSRLYKALGKAREKVDTIADSLNRVQVEVEEVYDAQAATAGDLETIARALLFDTLGIEVIVLEF